MHDSPSTNDETPMTVSDLARLGAISYNTLYAAGRRGKIRFWYEEGRAYSTRESTEAQFGPLDRAYATSVRSLSEVAQLLDLPLETVRHIVRRRLLRAIRRHQQYWVEPEEIERFRTDYQE